MIKLDFIVWNVKCLKRHCKRNLLTGLYHIDPEGDLFRECMGKSIVCLTETWCMSGSDHINDFPGYFGVGKIRNFSNSISNGGILVFIKESLKEHVRFIDNECTELITFSIDEYLMPTNKPLLCCVVYVPHSNSNFYNNQNVTGIESLEINIDRLLSRETDDFDLCLLGDFNSRTGEEKDFIDFDTCSFLPIDTSVYNPSTFCKDRKSKDKVYNEYGLALLELCKDLDVHILNGRFPGDEYGNFTFQTDRGNSVIDYIMLSSSVFNFVMDFKVLTCDVSDHFPIYCVIGNAPTGEVDAEESKALPWERYYWKEEKKTEFLNMLSGQVSSIENIKTKIREGNINEGTEDIINIFQEAGKNMVKKNRNGVITDTQPKWFDKECQKLKIMKYRSLNKFRLLNTTNSLENYKCLKRQFKALCEQKKKKYNDSYIKNISSKVEQGNPWGVFKSFKRSKGLRNNIKIAEWVNHFEKLLNRAVDDNYTPTETLNEIEINTNILNEPISMLEVNLSIANLKNGKSSGPDGLPGEFFKYCSNDWRELIMVLFRELLNQNAWLSPWWNGILLPLLKKGNPNDPSNYRGLTLSNVLSKMFLWILNKRLNKWLDLNNKLLETQAGFRKGYSTSDNMFILDTILQKYLTKPKGRVYIFFVDFSKAFDQVPRELLMERLAKEGVDGQFFDILKTVYSETKVQILTNYGLSNSVGNDQGVKQGCPMSPSLFNIFIKPLSKYIKDMYCSGINIGNETPDIDALFFADDIALPADNVRDLQRKINALANFIKDFGLQINLDKSQIMVCRNGGVLRKNEKWHLNGKELKTTSYYKYLGLTFSTRLCWSKGVSTLVEQARKSFSIIKRFLLSINCEDIKMWFNMFDIVVVPILCYGSELWGYEVWNKIESYHLSVCKYILGVGKSTINSMVIGECGRFPLALTYQRKFIRYYIKIINMDYHRLPKRCFFYLVSISERTRGTWAVQVKNFLYEYGFFDVWESHEIGNPRIFLMTLEERMKSKLKNEWINELSSIDCANTYRDFKKTMDLESYFINVKQRKNFGVLTRFRLNRFGLRVDVDKHLNVTERICTRCTAHNIEDPFHVMGACKAYNSIRLKYFGYYKLDYNQFVLIMSSNCRNTQIETIHFLKDVISIRNGTNSCN